MSSPKNVFTSFFILLWQRITSVALTTVDIRDIFYFAGLGLLGYGIHLVLPWLAFVVCGLLLMLTGYIMGDK